MVSSACPTVLEPAGLDCRWVALWQHHDALLGLARSRVLCHDDAEDIVHEALALAVAKQDLLLETAGAWLNRVVRNKCVDLAREHGYQRHRTAFQVLMSMGDTPAEEIICDVDEARHLRQRLALLPPRQQQALLLRAEGLKPAEIAAHMDATAKSVENLLSKARRALRQSVVGLAAVLAMVRRPRRGTAAHSAAILAVAACALAIARLGAPGTEGDRSTAPQYPTSRVAVVQLAVPSVPRKHSTVHRPLERGSHEVFPRNEGRILLPARMVHLARSDLRSPAVTQYGLVLDFATTLQKCVQDGVEVNPSYVGCRGAPPAG